MWADGLTAVYAPSSTIRDNVFADNSDIGLIIGQGASATITNNRIEQRRQHGFAGLMLDNFNSNDLVHRGDFRGAVVAANTIDCSGLCDFGIELGPHPWYPSRNIVGGEVRDNQISGAGVAINIAGAGTSEAPIGVFDNRIDVLREPVALALCDEEYEAIAMNISPDSVVDRHGDAARVTRRDWHDCH
jgi:hypothetical protein